MSLTTSAEHEGSLALRELHGQRESATVRDRIGQSPQ